MLKTDFKRTSMEIGKEVPGMRDIGAQTRLLAVTLVRNDHILHCGRLDKECEEKKS